MIEKRKNYVYGSAAEKIEYDAVEKPDYDVYEKNSVLKNKRKYKSNRKTKLKMVLLTLVGFCVCFLIMARYALITKLSYNYSEYRAQHDSIKAENSILEVFIENETDLGTIKELAEQKLNMKTPDRSQIVYVEVPKDDFTTIADAYKTPNETKNSKNVFVMVVDAFSKFLSTY